MSARSVRTQGNSFRAVCEILGLGPGIRVSVPTRNASQCLDEAFRFLSRLLTRFAGRSIAEENDRFVSSRVRRKRYARPIATLVHLSRYCASDRAEFNMYSRVSCCSCPLLCFFVGHKTDGNVQVQKNGFEPSQYVTRSPEMFPKSLVSVIIRSILVIGVRAKDVFVPVLGLVIPQVLVRRTLFLGSVE